jgi:hypothetical protein
VEINGLCNLVPGPGQKRIFSSRLSYPFSHNGKPRAICSGQLQACFIVKFVDGDKLDAFKAGILV